MLVIREHVLLPKKTLFGKAKMVFPIEALEPDALYKEQSSFKRSEMEIALNQNKYYLHNIYIIYLLPKFLQIFADSHDKFVYFSFNFFFHFSVFSL